MNVKALNALPGLEARSAQLWGSRSSSSSRGCTLTQRKLHYMHTSRVNLAPLWTQIWETVPFSMTEITIGAFKDLSNDDAILIDAARNFQA